LTDPALLSPSRLKDAHQPCQKITGAKYNPTKLGHNILVYMNKLTISMSEEQSYPLFLVPEPDSD
jgi:hypothetical protein